jgi:6-phosphogluconolactonase (cycloisomerase 2 family)
LRSTVPSLAAGPPTFAYITNYRDNTVAMYTLEPGTGQLHQFGTPVPAEQGPRAIAVHPSGHVAYVTNQASSTVTTYRIDGEGQLTP